MWVEKRAKDNYKFVEQYKDPLTGKNKRVSLTLDKNTAHTRKQAQAALEAKIQQRLLHVKDGTLKHGITLKQLSEEWLKNYHTLVKYHTYDNAKSRTHKIISDIGNDVLVEKVKPVLLEDYLNSLIYKQNYKNSSVMKFKGTLGNMFRYAYKHNYIKTNPISEVEVNYRTEEITEKASQKFLDDDELKQVLEFMYKRSPHYGRFCEFLYLTGMRYGEVASLYRSDIHKQDNGKVVATVNSTLVNGQKQPSPKTSSSRREVTLTKRAQLIVKQELVDHPFKSNFIFESKQGHPLGNVVLNYWLRQAKSELKIDKTLSLHAFRHTHISKLAELGVPLYLIQNRVGHKDAETTKEIYLHVTKKAEQKLDSKLNLL